MDEHGDAESASGLPDDVQLRVVQLEPRPVRLLCAQSETLADLADAHGTRGDVGLELRGDARAGARSDIPEIERGEEYETVFVACGANRVDLAREALAGAARACTITCRLSSSIAEITRLMASGLFSVGG